MDNQHDICRADMAAFLTELGYNLKKEGWALQALAKRWFEGSHEDSVFRAFGISIDAYGDELLAIREHLCQQCQMTPVVTGITIGKSQDEKASSKPKQSGTG